MLFRLAFKDAIGTSLKENFKTGRERQVYAATNGEASTREIAAKFGVGHTTVARLWQRWLRAGILERTDAGGYQALISLANYPDLEEEIEDGGRQSPKQSPD